MTRREDLRLSFLRALAFVTFPPPLTRLEGTAKILVVRPDHLGDVLFTTPALRHLREALPEASISYLVGTWSKEIVAGNPNIDEVLTCDFPGFTRRPKTSLIGPYLYLRQQARKLRALEFDVAINLRFDFWWGAMLTYFADIPHRIGYATPETKPFLNLAIPYPKGRHEVLQNLRLSEVASRLIGSVPAPLTAGETNHDLEFNVRDEDEAFADGWLSVHSTGRPIVLVHPGTGSPIKLWRPEGFSQVADALVENYGLQVLLSGSKSEEPLVSSISRDMRHAPAVLIGANMGQMASILRKCRLAVGVDSGIMHLSSAVRIPTVRLYGPVDDTTFGPWGEPGQHIVVKSNMDCIPCNRLAFKEEELADHLCVKSISVKQVLVAVESLLGGNT